MRRRLALAVCLLAAMGCEFFKATEPHTVPCVLIRVDTMVLSPRDTVYVSQYAKTFYCAIPG